MGQATNPLGLTKRPLVEVRLALWVSAAVRDFPRIGIRPSHGAPGEYKEVAWIELKSPKPLPR